MKLFEFSYHGRIRNKAPAIELEIFINPTATTKLPDWEIKSYVQGSLHYGKFLYEDIVPLHEVNSVFNHHMKDILSWVKSYKEV